MKNDRIRQTVEDALGHLDEQTVGSVIDQKLKYNERAKSKKSARILRFRPALIAAATVLLIAAIALPLIVMMQKAPEPAAPVDGVGTGESSTEETPDAAGSETSGQSDRTTPTSVVPSEPSDTPSAPTDPETPTKEPTVVTDTPVDHSTFVDPEPGSIDLLDLTGSVIPVSGMRALPDTVSDGGSMGEPPFPEFRTGFYLHTVVARFVDVLPDAYLTPGSSMPFRLIKAKIVDEIYGEGLPEEILVSMPDTFVNDGLFDYDCFVLSLYQYTIDGVREINAATSAFESLPAIFLPGKPGNVNYQNGSVIAFKDGQIDRSLWDLPGWKGILTARYGTMEFKDLCSNLFYYGLFYDPETKEYDQEGYLAYIDAGVFTLDDVVFALERKTARFNNRASYCSADSFEDAETLRYILDSGAFTCTFDPIFGQLKCTRIIDGYLTTEIYRLGKEGVLSSGVVAFTEEDLREMPDLSELVSQFDPSTPLLHVEEDWTISNRTERFACWYAKTENGVYGVARMIVDFFCQGGRFHDDFYLICDSAGEYRRATREEIVSIVGSSYVASFNYYEPDIEIIYCY